MNFPNTIDACKMHSQNVMLALTSRSFVTNEYTHHKVVDVEDAKLTSDDSYTDISQKEI